MQVFPWPVMSAVRGCRPSISAVGSVCMDEMMFWIVGWVWRLTFASPPPLTPHKGSCINRAPLDISSNSKNGAGGYPNPPILFSRNGKFVD